MMNKMMSSVAHLRVSGFIEGLSFIILLAIAMPLKYMADMPAMVRYTGAIHGGLFVWYIFSILWVRMTVGISTWHMILAFLASLVPFGTFYADRKLFSKLHDGYPAKTENA